MIKSFSDGLQVCIPTYNRPDKLEKQVVLLLEQISDNDHIIIIDNNSDSAVYDGAIYDDKRVTVLYNTKNIGICGNIIKCLELNYCEWSWLLSDDDIILTGSIDIIKSNIIKNDADFYNYTSLVPRTTELHYSGISEYLNCLDHFGNQLLISNNIYRTSILKSYAGSIFYGSVMSAPQIGPIISALSNDNSITGVFCKEKIVSWGTINIENSWSRTCFFNTIFLVDLLDDFEHRKVLFGKIRESLPHLHALVAQLSYSSVNFDQKNDTLIFYKKIELYYSSLGSISDKLWAYLYRLCLYFPKITFFIMSKLFFLKNKKKLQNFLQKRSLKFYI
jgi:glycosyltransferase involved in cell wall biosynthesis